MRIHHLLAALLCLPLGLPAQEEANPAAAEKNENPIVVIETSMGTIEAELFEKAAPKTVKNFIDLAEGAKEFTDVKTGEKVKRPFYDGLVFHRVIDKFMIQGGCPRGNGSGDPGYKFEDEFNYAKLGLDKVMCLNEEGEINELGGREVQQFGLRKVATDLGITDNQQFQQRRGEVIAALQKMSVAEVLKLSGRKDNPALPACYKPTRGCLAMANSGPNTNGSQFFINVVDTKHLTGRHTVFGKVVKGMDIVDKISKVKVDAQSKPAEDVVIESIRLKKAAEEPAEEAPATPEDK